MTDARPQRSPRVGQFVSLRGRLWMVEGEPDAPLSGHQLACIDDDASGEDARVLWSAEVDARLHDEEAWTSLGIGGGDAATFSAYLRTVRWRTATMAERDLFQAPFRAGIRLDPYQLLPLRKALRLPRVNLLIADDVGLGKTVEAGLVLRELLLRRRVDYTVVLAPAAMTGQWRDELQTKFGLSFEIIDARHLETLRRRRGYGANPWAAGSRFILSHRLLTEETYAAGLRDVLERFRARSLLILDEAHHAAPAGGGRYAIESQFTRALRDLSDRFEHRLFLSATPHNGHPNSFATLLELLDPQRFTRGVPVRPADLDPVMVRRLKSDLRALGEAFPERVVEPIVIDNLPADAPELALAAMLADYRTLRERRVATLPPGQAARARLAFVGLQQRLLSSIPAFARTLRVHLAGLDRAIAGQAVTVATLPEIEAPDRIEEEAAALNLLDRADAAEVEAAAISGTTGAAQPSLMAERACVVAMLTAADAAKADTDARMTWILDWARRHLLDAEGQWGTRRLILFTEYEDTRRWLRRQLSVLLDPADVHEADRIDSFTGMTSTERREGIKRAFNDPTSPLRILLCTDAAREGINLQSQCHDLIHVDLPWNPSRLEQRNGRIDRKLQPSPTVTCRYFVYAQRPEDVVLDALVRKTELIRRQLGSAGHVLGARIADRLGGGGIDRATAPDLADRIRHEEADDRVRAAVRDLDDGADARLARLRTEQADLTEALNRARARVGVDPADLQSVVGLALARAGGAWTAPPPIGDTPVFALDQQSLAGDPSWLPLLDDLRARPLKAGEHPGEWRAQADAVVRRISFAPAILPDGRDAGDVVQLHLEHRLVRRLLGRFMSAGFRSGLERACVIRTTAGTTPRVILLGRLALYGDHAARLHEEVLSVAADWRPRTEQDPPLRVLAEGREAESRVLDELIDALRVADDADPDVADACTAQAARDVADLRPALEARAAARIDRIAAELTRRASSEARGLEALLEHRIARIARERGADDGQLSLLLDPAEARQRAADRRSWERAASRLDDERIREPERLRAAARVHATRLEPIGLVYLQPDA